MKSKEFANKNLRNLFKTGTRTNTLKVERSAGYLHEQTKSYLFTKLVYFGGHIVVVNGKLKNGKCPDIVILDLEEPFGYEIINSETEKMTEAKAYPFKVIRIDQLKFNELFEDL